MPAGSERTAGGAGSVQAIQQQLPVDRTAAWKARQQIRDLNGQLAEEERHVAMLLTSELVANSVLHSGAVPGDTIALLMHLTDRTIRVEVHDSGPGFEPRRRVSPTPAESHWGLEIVEGLANRWGVAPGGGGTMVWFELDRAV
jgi:anti-sigma regulatory factor (Ser/Thr protein kinase)